MISHFPALFQNALLVDILEDLGLQGPASTESATRRPMANSKTLDRILGTMIIRERLTEVSDESENTGRKKCKKKIKGEG